MSQVDHDTHQGSHLHPMEMEVGSWILALEYRRPAAGSLGLCMGELDELMIGRGDERSVLPSADGRCGVRVLRVPDPYMSRPHARLVRIGTGWSVLDLGSKNGVLVNGAPLQRAALADGDMVEIGQSMFCYRQRHGFCDDGELPPLRERREDLGELVASVLRAAYAAGDAGRITFTKRAGRALFHHDWPSDVCELEACLTAAVARAGDGVIDVDHLGLPPAPPAAGSFLAEGSVSVTGYGRFR